MPICCAATSSAERAKVLLRDVKLLVFDFDGVMTDNRVLVFEDGREAVLCSRGDGMGLDLLKKSGLPLAVISKEVNPVVSARCRKLKIPCEQGIDDKLSVLGPHHRRARPDPGRRRLHGQRRQRPRLHDRGRRGDRALPTRIRRRLRAARLVTAAAGGFGAVREVCDLLLAGRAEAPAPA